MTDVFARIAWLIPCYPLVGMVLSMFWFPSLARRTGPRPAGYINLAMTGLALVHAALGFIEFGTRAPLTLELPWLQVADLTLTLPLEVSAVNLGAIVLVTSINLLAQLYAIGYLEMDWGWARFFALLALFEAGMCLLALCDSLFFSYIILEILTLGTYLLVGFWFNQSLVVTGARDAFLTKRVGDLLLLMGVLALYPIAGTWNFSELAEWAQTAEVDPTLMSLVGLALLAGPMGKCAQFPLHLWLDEAMEGPYPSTVLRNSVVVATGAWVLTKLEPVLALSPVVMATVTAIGIVTALGGTAIAIAQVDVKRSLSYLTSAYMGLVFVAVGTQQSHVAFLLLLTHALAVVALLMSTGSIVLNSISQDLTKLGGLWSRRPISGLSFVAGAAGLIAMPPLGGFWAALALINGVWEAYPVLAGILLVVNALAAFGVTRVFCLIFGNRPQQMSERSPENLWPVTLPMVFAAALTLHLPLVLQSLGLLPSFTAIDKGVALLLVISSVWGCGLGSALYLGPAAKPIRLPWTFVQNLLASDFYTPRIYRASIVGGVDIISRVVDWCDRHVVDGLVNLIGLTSLFGGEALKYGNTGKTQFYVLTIALGLLVITLFITRSFWLDFAALAGS
ncbi:NAD(P)H dehydrogenase, subunit NdhF3 family [Rubidibacter lacunae KORDI 51-2]|uniref:NAD(P)H dehydrogenase, subunit NdhF3 family n=1 Tax=Rubidibacter lacunae KORDI 51-2 TaxID=582515 RepID=U5DNK3_9CHRO|nr:NAD(P)H-quinone oxidoreductase subunit F [Rubidibacter lacunae]ERN42184.1 NAD(P)H dehydrogenase, subunit NdhF3 family [Rubidibacter lacunae KORDI 51-2]